MIVYLNGKLVPETRAAISINDHGFLYGDGVYETLRIYDGKPFLLDKHLRRLKKSLAGISLTSPMSLKSIGFAVVRTIRANRHREAVVRITITRGPGGHGFDPRVCRNPTVLITSRPFAGYPRRFARDGMSAAVVSIRRNSPEALPPTIKSTSCLNNVLAKIESIRRKADEGILLNDDGNVSEGTVSNVFLVKDGRLFTPALDGTQLPGVTRELVCKLARKEGIHVAETKVSLDDLKTADELFLTSTLMEVMPVGRLFIGDSSARKLKVGPVTRRMMICYTASRR